MKIKVSPYIAPADSGQTPAAAEKSASVKSATFQETLALAQRALQLDKAIAEAKQAGEAGLSIYSAKAFELGVGRTRNASPSASSSKSNATEQLYNIYSNSNGITPAGNYGNALACSSEFNSYFDEAARTYDVDVKLLKAIAKVESGFNPSAVSSAGAVGVMQLMPQTAAGLGVDNSYNAYKNIMGGAKYIAQQLDKYNGNVALALAAYNAGGANVDKYGGIPPFAETENYVAKVIGYFTS